MAARGPEDQQGPRVRVAALMVVEGKVVLVRHRAGSSRYHLLPGGGVDQGETLSEALRREIAEETGFDAHIGRLLYVNDTIDPAGTRHLVNITFEAQVVGGAIAASQDPRVEAVDLVEPWRLPELDLRPPIAEPLIEALADGEHVCGYLGSLFTEGR